MFFFLSLGPKPPTVLPPTTEVPTVVKPRRPSSTHSTDIDDEIINGRIGFRPSREFRQTPGPYPDHDEYEDDSDRKRRRDRQIHRPRAESPRIKSIDESTQSEDKSTRNVGTMHEPVQTRNFGNEVQPQTSATQTSSLLRQKPPPKTRFTYIERTDDDDTYPDQRISPRPDEYDYDHYKPRSPSPQVIRYSYDDYSHRRRRSPMSPPISYHSVTNLAQDHRPPLSIYRPHTPSPPRRTRSPSPYRRPRSATPRYRPPMYSQETDTSLDAMKHQQHIGVQYEPRSTREKGTTPSIRVKKPTPSHRPIETSIYPTSQPSLPRAHDRYYIQPTTDDYPEEEEEEQEDEAPSMHDQSTMAELIVSLDHYTQCDSQPYMADHYVQTSPTLDEDDLPKEPVFRELSTRRSIIMPQPMVIQPDSLPRPRRPQHSSKRDGLDYTGKNLEVSLRHGQQQRTTSQRNSPLLNIGTQHIIHQSPTNEYTVPFETRYVYDSMRSSTLRSRSNSSIIVPVLNSPRTHMFTHSPVHQSRSNGNFYLSTAPARSLNSSFRLNITANES